MTREAPISRRVFLTRAGTMTLTLGSMPLWLPRIALARSPYAAGVWLAGDHHIHTKYSPDGQYEIDRQIAQAARHGLNWCVITDHGGPRHDKVALAQAYPELLAARARHSAMHIFQGLEWNVPDAEHASIILPPSPEEAKLIAEFEARYDGKNFSRPNTPANAEADALAAVKYLQSLTPKPLFVVNHPARTGRVSPMELRAWADAGPDVSRGFEAAPGHQAASLVGSPRGHYDKQHASGSWSGYPKTSYRTWGGYDWYVSQVGGLWDSLLGEGRPWYITANSDSHRHYTDHTVVDMATYLTHGYVTPTKRKSERHGDNIDFWPGEYTKTWVFAASPDPLAILSALRTGSMFTVHGDLIDRLELGVTSADASAPMGGTLVLDRRGEDVEVVVRIREVSADNFAGRRPRLDHIDLIAGDILGPAADRESMTNPTTRIVEQAPAKDVKRQGEWLELRRKFTKVEKSFYVRLRGTNRAVDAPEQDTTTVDPWDDLWFYSNPIFVHIGPFDPSRDRQGAGS